jgi:hypothetical protein
MGVHLGWRDLSHYPPLPIAGSRRTGGLRRATVDLSADHPTGQFGRRSEPLHDANVESGVGETVDHVVGVLAVERLDENRPPTAMSTRR